MINILIIEDEVPARNKLKRFLEALATKTSILAEIDNVEEAVGFLKTTKPDLIFSDIELLDGNAFEIYNQVAITCPIIFVTAYDQFWMDAFESNGIATSTNSIINIGVDDTNLVNYSPSHIPKCSAPYFSPIMR